MEVNAVTARDINPRGHYVHVEQDCSFGAPKLPYQLLAPFMALGHTSSEDGGIAVEHVAGEYGLVHFPAVDISICSRHPSALRCQGSKDGETATGNSIRGAEDDGLGDWRESTPRIRCKQVE
jgi:hypothetical protein